MRKRVALILILFAGLSFWILFEKRPVFSEQKQRVWVENFPKVQQIVGAVTLDRPTPHSVLVRLEGMVIPPVALRQSLLLPPTAVLDTSGYTSVVLSFQGEVKTRLLEHGSVGALLVPEEEPLTRAIREKGQVHFPLEVTADLISESIYFGTQARAALGFPRYRLYLFNNSENNVEANLYVYLTH